MNISRDPSWDDQRAFLAVMEEGSLSGAARRLSVSQPTIRARVAALEAVLGKALFTRSVTGMVPTAEAHGLLGHARAMQRASEALVRSASGAPQDPSGVVRLSVSEFVGIEILPPMLARLRENHPALRLEIVLSNRSANLLEQEADIALRMTEPRQQSLVVRKVAAIPLGFFAHHAYLARRGTPATLDDLSRHDLIGPDRAQGDLAAFAGLFPDLPADRMAIRTDSHPAQLAAARAGLGIAVVQVPAAERHPELARVLPHLTVATLDTWIATHEDLRHLPRIRVVMDHLDRAFAEWRG